MSTFAIGDEVSLPQGHKAILRWIGRIPNRGPTEYAGVELVGPESRHLGKHSGDHEGKQYFETEVPGTGLFISYTQLVSANIKTPRLPPSSPAHPVAPSASPVAASPAHFANAPGDMSFQATWASPSRVMSPGMASPSPRFLQRPSMGRLNAVMNGSSTNGGSNGASISTTANIPPGNAVVDQLHTELDAVKSQLDAERQDFEARRQDFRLAIQATNRKVENLISVYESKLEEVKNDYEKKLRQARRSSMAISSPSEAEIDEQRLALAAMQNKLIAERTEKQEEVDSLKRELSHLRELAGSAVDLESLVNDLGKYEQELGELRSKVNNMDSLEAEVARLKKENAKLANASSGSHSAKDYEQLERALETKLMRESELELDNEQLHTEVKRLETKIRKLEESHANSTATPAAPRVPASPKAPRATAAPSVPVPKSLSEFEQDTSIVDMAAGRTDWCSLCEREGHSAVDCPYE